MTRARSAAFTWYMDRPDPCNAPSRMPGVAECQFPVGHGGAHEWERPSGSIPTAGDQRRRGDGGWEPRTGLGR